MWGYIVLRRGIRDLVEFSFVVIRLSVDSWVPAFAIAFVTLAHANVERPVAPFPGVVPRACNADEHRLERQVVAYRALARGEARSAVRRG